MDPKILIPLLAALAVISIAGAMLLARLARRVPLRNRLRAIQGEVVDAEEAIGSGQGFADLVGGLGKAVSSGKTSGGLRETLTQAGYHSRAAGPIYMGSKVLFGVCGLLGAGVLVAPLPIQASLRLMMALSLAILCFFIPNVVVYARRSARRAEIHRHLPDAIDLLEICASAGMGLDMAWNSVADEVRAVSPMLADEMALTTLEIHLGSNRADAMRSMAQRTGVTELSSLVAVLVQSERFETSIIDALRVFATSMRETRSMLAQEEAEKMAVKLIFPMVLLIFPAMLLVLAGPATIQLYYALTAN